MRQRRGYFISRLNGYVFRTWGQAQFKQALRQQHNPIVRKDYLMRLTWEIQRTQQVAA